MHKLIIPTLLLIFFSAPAQAAITASGGAASSTAAPAIPLDSCDPLYNESLKSRAWLEAEREITQNQNLIAKPDSVLEYSCFDKLLSEVANGDDTIPPLPGMFSESFRWLVPPLPFAIFNLDMALNFLIEPNYMLYIGNNFPANENDADKRFLGGRSGVQADQPPLLIFGGQYECSRMNDIWMEAKCSDFITNPAEEGFFTFTQYTIDQDKRYLPERCAGIQSRWRTQRNMALGVGPPANNYQADKAVTPWFEDDSLTYIKQMDTQNCTDDSIVKPIPTGIIVKRPSQTPKEYELFTCAPAGCNYKPTGMHSGQCVKAN